VNAVFALSRALPADVLAARHRRETGRATREPLRLARRWELDLAGFLNGFAEGELRVAAERFLGDAAGSPGALRQRLWAWGAGLECAALGVAASEVSSVQPVPLVKRGRLVLSARRATAARGVLPAARAARFPAPAAAIYPRRVPAARPAPAFDAPPSSLDELLARADALLGVRLGPRGRDKGF
jgi:hypothetical protein